MAIIFPAEAKAMMMLPTFQYRDDGRSPDIIPG